MSHLKWIAFLLVGLAASTAHAARPTTGYVVGTPRAASKRSIGRGTVIYFAREGGKYTLGDPDSRQNVTNIHAGVLTPFECGDAKWAQVMACLKDRFLPYDVQVTDVDPGQQDHIETVIAGSPEELGQSMNTGGIAPLGCGLAYDNPVAFAFSTPWSCDVDQLCWAAAQETAHTVGLDHSVECTDAMTYDQSCGNVKHFTDIDKPCGEDSHLPPNTPPPNPGGPRKCMCTSQATQDSHQTLLGIFGKRGNSAPTVAFAHPHEAQAVSPGFAIELTVDDDFGLAQVDILVDGVALATSASPPYRATAPATLANGEHTVTARALDTGGLTTEVTIHVKQQPPCVTNQDCPATAVCAPSGDCVDGPGAPGGLGAPCTGDATCGSGRCLSGPDGQRCVEACDPAASTCPMGFDCLNAGTSNQCWPGADVLTPPDTPSSGGCRVGGVHTRAPFAVLCVLLVGLALHRRRSRR